MLATGWELWLSGKTHVQSPPSLFKRSQIAVVGESSSLLETLGNCCQSEEVALCFGWMDRHLQRKLRSTLNKKHWTIWFTVGQHHMVVCTSLPYMYLHALLLGFSEVSVWSVWEIGCCSLNKHSCSCVFLCLGNTVCIPKGQSTYMWCWCSLFGFQLSNSAAESSHGAWCGLGQGDGV